MKLSRRRLLIAGSMAGALLAERSLRPEVARAEDVGADIVQDLIGGTLTPSERVQFVVPPTFPIGASVPATIVVDSAMTEADNVRRLRLFAPNNPIIEIMSFNFTTGASVPRVSTRIRLAKPQHVFAVAEMNDGTFLMAKHFVDVATDGCAGG